MDNRRKTILINKPFQYQHSLLIAALAVLLVNGFLIARLLFPGDSPLDMTFGQLTGLAVLELLLIAVVWYASLKASHRIAGPVFVFVREIARLGNGDLNAKVVLRDKDMFQPEAQQINQSIAALGTRLSAIRQLADQLKLARENGNDTGPIVEQLVAEVSLFSGKS